MKKKFSKILGVALSVTLLLSLVLMAAPASADPDAPVVASLTVAPTPVSGLMTVTVVASDADGDLDTLDLDFGNSPYGPAGAMPAWTFDRTPTEIPTNAQEWGFVSASYAGDGTSGTWTIVVDTTRKWHVGDTQIPGGIMPGQEVWFDGTYPAFTAKVTDEAGGNHSLPILRVLFDNDEEITPPLGLNAKGAQQQFWLNYIDVVAGDNVTAWFWSFVPGVNLSTWGQKGSPFDVWVLDGGPYVDNFGITRGSVTGPTPSRFIEIWSRAPELGDCEIKVFTGIPEVPGEAVEVASAEKKWGELDHSKLDVHIDFEFDDHPAWSEIKAAAEADLEVWVATDHEVYVDAGLSEEEPVKELVAEKVWASFLQLEDPEPAGGALVHWWLALDTEDNQEWIQNLMDEIVARAGDLGFRGHDPDEVDSNEYWSATGDYDPTEHLVPVIMDWIDPPLTANDKFATKTDLYKFVPAISWDPYLEKETPMGDTPFINDTIQTEMVSGSWYGRSVTMDYHPGEIPGVTLALLENVGQEDVLIITLVEYQEDYNGENLILIQIGKKHFGVPPPPSQVKTTQLRWAGEKIVLEKDWGTDYIGNLVMFALEEGSIGVLIPLDPYDGDAAPTALISSDSRTVFTYVDSYGVARVMFKTEQQGQVDVECVLYGEPFDQGASFDQVNTMLDGWVVEANTGFVVYYLFLEEVTPWEPAPQPVDPDEHAVFAVDVKGTFWTTSLPGTTRQARIITFETDVGPMEYELPYGRYVLPDDWPLMAGPNWRLLRPWMDIMADPGNVSSDYELGPFSPVNSPSGVAALPTIGPFSSLQQWSTVDQWLTSAMVPADNAADMDPFTAGIQRWPTRNTVIPDDWVSPFDAPMPPAEIHFIITDSSPPMGVTPSLSEAFKNTGPTYNWPFFAAEIPAHPLIPPMLGTVEGFWWDSWEFGVGSPEGAYTPNNWATGVLNREGPYWFHIDLEQTPMDRTILEVYSDNLGSAAVYIDALGGAGWVTIEAKADYPYLPAKFPPVVSDEVTQIWGPIELNPHFLADEQVVEVGDTVTFTNLTTGGTLPYTDADWNWGDGTTHGITAVNNGETIPHIYNTPGVYSVILTMTDSTPTTRWEERPNYITVVPGPVVDDILAYYRALTGDALVADLADVVAAANDYLGGVIPPGFMAPITLSQLVELANEWLGV